MRIIFGCRLGAQWTLLAVCSVFADAAHADCIGPPGMMAQFRAHPSNENAILLGSWFASKSQFECAVEIFRGSRNSDPESAQLHYLEGLALVGGGHLGEAIPALQESIRLKPQVIQAHLMLATLYEQSRQSAEADEQWKQALVIDPRSAPALEGWSSAMLARRDYISVIGLLKHAPRTETLAIYLAKAYGILNDLDAAINALNEAMKLMPRSLSLADAESVVLVKQMRYDEAVRLLTNAVQQHPGNLDAEVLLFRVLVLTKHFDRARPMASKLLAQLPHDPSVLYLNGVVDRAAGDEGRARAHLEESVSLDPNFPYSRFNLGKVLVTLHEWSEAKEQLEKAIALGESDPQIHYELALALRGVGDKDRAAQEIIQYQALKKAEEDGLEASMSAIQGDREMANGNMKDAITQYRSACLTAPGNAGYKFKLSAALHQAGDLDGERAQLEEAVKLDPRLAAAQEQLGYLLSRSGDAEKAIEHFKMAVQAAPDWVEAWIKLGAELTAVARFPEARQAAAIALRLDQANQQARQLSDRLARDTSAHP